MPLLEPTRGRHSTRDRVLDDDRVLSFRDWCGINGFSEATGRRLRAAGKGPIFIRLSERRIGVTVRNNRQWQEARSSSAVEQGAA